jgi:hypothetical protein
LIDRGLDHFDVLRYTFQSFSDVGRCEVMEGNVELLSCLRIEGVVVPNCFGSEERVTNLEDCPREF